MRKVVTAGLAAILVTFPLATVHAAGGGGGGGAPTSNQCPRGKIWDRNQEECVDPQKSEVDTDSIYEYGRLLAMQERYGEAIEVLSLAADSGDPRVLNYLGYSHRKQGRVNVGLGYYQEALTIDPDFVLAREYMGEAYLQLGDLAAAQRQLVEIEKRCGTGCEEYAELAALISDRKD